MEDIPKKSSPQAAASAAAAAVVSDMLQRWPRLARDLTQAEVDKARTDWTALIRMVHELPAPEAPLEDEEGSGLDLLLDASKEATEGEAILNEFKELRQQVERAQRIIAKHLSPQRKEGPGYCVVVCPICGNADEHKADCYWIGKVGKVQ
jgi:hypothetical protein